MPWIKHRGGPIDADFRIGWEGRLLAELAYEDPKEDLSVTVLHESGWYLSVLPDGNVRWHQTKEDVPENGIVIDATAPIEHVVDEILRRCQSSA